MKFSSTRLVTRDVRGLAVFYEKFLGMAAKGDGDYVEFRPEGAILAIVSQKAAQFMHGGEWMAGANRSAILEFAVEDVDQERKRIDSFVLDWLQQPKDMPWGNRSMIFRDPEGNPINVFSHVKAAS